VANIFAFHGFDDRLAVAQTPPGHFGDENGVFTVAESLAELVAILVVSFLEEPYEGSMIW